MVYQFLSIAIKRSRERLYNFGQLIEQATWQSIKSPDTTWELLNHSFSAQIPPSINELIGEVGPSLPWAENHFLERIGGIPLNPPPSEAYWPYNIKKANDQFKAGEKFSHTYPERFWPKWDTIRKESGAVIDVNRRRGIRFAYGDYHDVITLLINDTTTRQAYLPIWFPEDTGATDNQRVPCSLGYHFIIRNGYLHVNYYIRSCDIIRHFQNDVYLTARLVFDIIEHLNKAGVLGIKPGMLSMHITSLHCFRNERELLKPKNYEEN